MSENGHAYYEGMFLFSQSTAADLAGVIDHVNEILARAGAEVIAMKKWDERRLAYEIKKQKRGTYVLVYFKADADRIVGIERDCNLSEKVLRLMVLRADHMTEEEMLATDAREDLAAEARQRAERAAEQADQGTTGVTLGAPKREEGEAPAAESAPEPPVVETPAPDQPAEEGAEQKA
jgi:small subunit ribosomal protein S6